jgi:hypothetical protein
MDLNSEGMHADGLRHERDHNLGNTYLYRKDSKVIIGSFLFLLIACAHPVHEALDCHNIAQMGPLTLGELLRQQAVERVFAHRGRRESTRQLIIIHLEQ